jgi:LacI family transcriptional regulator
MPTHMTCFRELLRGINAFANAKPSWQMHYHLPIDNLLRFIDQHKPDGLLAGPLAYADAARDAIARVPHCVGVCAWLADSGIEGLVEFESDDKRVGEQAAKHFLEKGYRQFAFVGSDITCSHLRAAGFRSEIERAGFSCALLDQEFESTFKGRGWDNLDREGQLVNWLNTLQRPLALLACNDIRARAIAQVCRNQGIRVPEDIAILGVDNDDLECTLSDPPLSSVVIPWRRIGYEAAAMLDRILDGDGQIQPQEITIPPVGVVERQSTDSISVSDPDVAAAVRYIRQHAHERTSVDDILREVPIGRRSLEKRFRAVLKRSPLDEIRRVHIERAKQLLAMTELSIPEVARASGFGGSTWFSEAFHAQAGQSPAQYRKRFQRTTPTPTLSNDD